jgi:pimeloyl-ACP methyl ester carboxylesterase
MIAAYLWIIILNILAKLLFYPRVSEGYSLGKRLSYGEFSPEVYSFTWIKQSFRHNGLKLRYDILPLSPSRWCFLVHGAGARPHSMYKHLTFWRKKGYSCVVTHNRGHGESQYTNPTYGVKEHQDLLQIVQKIRLDYPKMSEVIFHGESLGAATVLLIQQKSQHSLRGLRVACIADCSFSSLSGQISHGLRHFPGSKLFFPLILFIIRWSLKRFGNFDLREASPISFPEADFFPTLFIHGLADRYVPPSMSKELHAKWIKHQSLTSVYFQPGAKHAASWRVHSQSYESAVSAWLRIVQPLVS